MSLQLVQLAEEANLLPVPSVVFPLIAVVVFAALGIVTWSYHDVAHRHAHKTDGPHSAGESGHEH